MLLVIDIGNTHLVVGVYQANRLIARWRLSSNNDRTSDEMAAFLDVAFRARKLGFSQIRGVAISSVVPAQTPQAARLAKEYFHLEPLVVGSQTDTGLKNAYENPREVGADRLVNALAAWQKYSCACVIADFGTATTVDAVSSEGVYIGGAIAPGLQISTDALFQAAARLPRVEICEPPDGNTLARSTSASMQAGIVYGYAGMVKELTSRCVAELNVLGEKEIKVLATGGLAELVAPLVPQIDRVEADLTLEGLRLLWEKLEH